ncbi:MAG: class I SAM-dependent methyltransferase [Candidatus Aenigmarchaeota archaeon]|nr:class I SAM-dependent methyltransferase [Candidatus Aenigmarchaeota archaeon]
MILKKLSYLEKESIERRIPIIGKEKGLWLYKKVLEAKPKRVLELGTANGYSGIILGSQGAELTTIEADKEVSEEAGKNFERFGVKAAIIVGDGVLEVEKLVEEKKNIKGFDIVFIDFANRKYILVLENCIKLAKKGGLIIADNIHLPKCEEYKQRVLNHPKLKTEIIDIKNGLACSVKI